MIATTPIHMDDIEVFRVLKLLARQHIYEMEHVRFTTFITAPYEDLVSHRSLHADLIQHLRLVPLHQDGSIVTDPKVFAKALMEELWSDIREEMRNSPLKEVVCPSSQGS